MSACPVRRPLADQVVSPWRISQSSRPGRALGSRGEDERTFFFGIVLGAAWPLVVRLQCIGRFRDEVR